MRTVSDRMSDTPVRSRVNRPIMLLLAALLLGCGHLARTQVVSEDGAYYIHQAQEFGRNPVAVAQGRPFGYASMVYVVHQLLSGVAPAEEVHVWILAGQITTLAAWAAAILLIYSIGCMLIGSDRAFLAAMIMLFLPYPSQMGADVLRDWPSTLFLLAGLLLLLAAARYKRLALLLPVGTVAAIGHLIRPEIAQIALVAGVWLLWEIVRRARRFSRMSLLGGFVWLGIGFALPAAPYIIVRGEVLPDAVQWAVGLYIGETPNTDAPPRPAGETAPPVEKLEPADLLAPAQGLGLMLKRAAEMLFLFSLPVGVGLFVFWKRHSLRESQAVILVSFLLFQVVVLLALYWFRGYMSRRHCLPLTVGLVFFAPYGLEAIRALLQRQPLSTGVFESRLRPDCVLVLLVVIGIAAGLPKLARPLGSDKRGLRDAGLWLQEHTAEGGSVAAVDRRIILYSGLQSTDSLATVSGSLQYVAAYPESIAVAPPSEPPQPVAVIPVKSKRLGIYRFEDFATRSMPARYFGMKLRGAEPTGPAVEASPVSSWQE